MYGGDCGNGSGDGIGGGDAEKCESVRMNTGHTRHPQKNALVPDYQERNRTRRWKKSRHERKVPVSSPELL